MLPAAPLLFTEGSQTHLERVLLLTSALAQQPASSRELCTVGFLNGVWLPPQLDIHGSCCRLHLTIMDLYKQWMASAAERSRCRLIPRAIRHWPSSFFSCDWLNICICRIVKKFLQDLLWFLKNGWIVNFSISCWVKKQREHVRFRSEFKETSIICHLYLFLKDTHRPNYDAAQLFFRIIL